MTINCSSEVEGKKSQERKEAYEKLYKLGSCGMRDNIWWRMPKYKEIHVEGYVRRREEEKVSPKDDMFGSEAAGKVFKTLPNFWLVTVVRSTS